MVTEQKTRTTTLSQLIRSYLIACRHLSPHTQLYYGTCLKNLEWFAHQHGWPEDASQITRDHVRELLNYIASTRNRWGLDDPNRSSSRQATPATVNHYGRVIKRLFRWASDEEEYVTDNGIWRLKLPSPAYRQIEPYTDGEVMAMLDACEEQFRGESRFLGSRNKAIIAVFADTGLRLSELANIKLSDLHPRLQQVKVMGKGSKMRVVPLQGESMKSLNRYLLHRPQEVPDWLWVSEDGTHFTDESITTMVERLKKRAGVTSGGMVHRFRHYFATRYLEAGGNPNSLRLLLGHESYAMVLHYTRLVSARKAVKEHEQFSPLNNLYRSQNHGRQQDGWGWKY
jgi:site-specific recombinase XerD